MKNIMAQTEQDFVQQNAGLQVIEKMCSKCKKTKPASEFFKSKRTKSGLQSQCKECKRPKCKIRSSVTEGFVLCRVCETEKLPTEDNFHPSKLTNNSKVLICRECKNRINRESVNNEEARRRHTRWRKNNRAHVRKMSMVYKDKNRESIRESDKEYRQRTDVKLARRKYERKYYKNNRDKMIAISCAYNSRVRKATPKWENQSEINKYYIKARDLGMEVDHIVPITSDIVCGLHCVANFQMLTREENASKGNRFWPDMP